MTSSAIELPSYPFGRDGDSVSQVYHQLKQAGPVVRVRLFNGREAWLVTGYDEARAVLGDPASSADRGRMDFPELNPRGHRKPGPGDFLHVDAPYHMKLRRMLAPEFTHRRIEELRARVQVIVDDLVDELLAGPKPVELVAAFAYPVPSRTICQLLGVPYDDHAHFEQLTQVIASAVVTREESHAALTELRAYLGELVERKLVEPGDDLISRMIEDHLRPGDITQEELTNMASILLAAGHETTGNMVALGIMALLAEPERLAVLTAEPELVPGAVEELLRYYSIIESAIRVAKADIEVGGTTIKEGDAILVGLAIANRDESLFPEPATIDIRRDARNQTAFGYGVHVCIGAPLARVELQIAYHGIATRIPGMRLAVPFADVEFKGHMNAFGVARLPVTW